LDIQSPGSFQNRWLAYFDLLGFKKLLDNYKDFPLFALEIYRDALECLDSSVDILNSLGRLIDYCWFSDTFIFWSENDSAKAFPVVEHVARLFFERLIMHEIPVRGSITFGQFYANKDKSIYMGQALIDAYEYAEKQQWLNYVLTPMLCSDLPRINLDPGKRINYCPITTSFKTRIFPKEPKNFDSSETFAFTYSADSLMRRTIHQSLNNLSQQYRKEEKRITDKYENSLSWLEFQKKRFPKIPN